MGHEARLPGRNGLAVTLAGRSQIYGRDERVTLFTRAMDDGDIFYFLFISPNDEYRDYSRTFERMLRSLRINDAAMHRQLIFFPKLSNTGQRFIPNRPIIRKFN